MRLSRVEIAELDSAGGFFGEGRSPKRIELVSRSQV